MEIRLGKENDINSWMSLVNKVKESFPGLETKEALDEHRDTVLDFMRNNSAICARIQNNIVGVLLFSKEKSMLCFLAVDAKYCRKNGILYAYIYGSQKRGCRLNIPRGCTARDSRESILQAVRFC